MFAAPKYLSLAGEPQVPVGLKDHSTLLMGSGGDAHWTLQKTEDGEAKQKIPISPRYLSNDMASLKRAAVEGLGIVALPQYVCRQHLEQAQLLRVLPAWFVGHLRISLLMPSRRGRFPAVKALVDALSLEFKTWVSG